MRLQRTLEDAGATETLGAALAAWVEPGTRIFLQGELGAGKTTLARGFLRQLGHAGRVKSPSFALLETYELDQLPVFHFDLYRMKSPAELESIGFRDYFGRDGICLVEWPELGAPLLGEPDMLISLRLARVGRLADLEANTARGERLLARLVGPN